MLSPSDHQPLAPTYSQICIAPLTATSKLISLSGQPGIGLDTDMSSPRSFADQVRAALANVDKCLKLAGASKKHIISTKHYLVRISDMKPEDFQARADIYVEWLDGLPAPAETLIGVHSMAIPAILYEIEVMALVN